MCGAKQESEPKFKVVKKTDTKWNREAKLCLPLNIHWAAEDPMTSQYSLINLPLSPCYSATFLKGG